MCKTQFCCALLFWVVTLTSLFVLYYEKKNVVRDQQVQKNLCNKFFKIERILIYLCQEIKGSNYFDTMKTGSAPLFLILLPLFCLPNNHSKFLLLFCLTMGAQQIFSKFL
eukprot:TRINITY_DN1821_c1_g4_i1.p5 TRINITY_DN1821_c1_g4~~TRINITY_DN1821_c1_g4_i1.p5  ORF type:complete len:110 (+),score=8.57 TRINITY_DN1821_c1_g4_i1:512-841(+)